MLQEKSIEPATKIKIQIAPDNGNNGRESKSAPLFEELRNEVSKGFLYTHSRANANSNKLLEVASFSYALIEILNEKGLITIEELDKRKQQVNQRLVQKFSDMGMGVALTKDAKDKYDIQNNVVIDCDNRLPLCHAACCRMRFALAVQDVEEGMVKWNLGQPYMIRQGSDGYCHHLKRQSCQCNIYDKRPFVCRVYDCRKDDRIWKDFDKKIISPHLDEFLKRPWLDGDNGHEAGAI